MKFRSRLIASVGLMLVLANVSFAQHVKTDYDHNAHFGQYRTYSWTNVQTRDPFLVDRIKNAVNSVLAAKGWMEVHPEVMLLSLQPKLLRISKP
jgi:Domain of unknown function (DUF4136)